MANNKAVANKDVINKKFGAKITWDESNDHTLLVDAKNLTELMTFLKEKGYDFLADVSAVDYKDKFAVLYQLFQFGGSEYLTIRVELDHDKPEVSTLCNLWDAANWLEREVYDLMGITFKFHPNLKRILMWEGYPGHPLRKDYVHVPSKYQGRRTT